MAQSDRKIIMTDLTPLCAGFATIGQGAGPMMVTWKAGLFTKHGLAIDKPRIMGGAKGVVRGRGQVLCHPRGERGPDLILRLAALLMTCPT